MQVWLSYGPETILYEMEIDIFVQYFGLVARNQHRSKKLERNGFKGGERKHCSDSSYNYD